MKKLFFILSMSLSVMCVKAQHPLIKDCTITKEYGMMSETFTLNGSVKVITDPKQGADFRVKIVSEAKYADLYVKKVTTRPYECGEWRFVESEKDAKFTVRFVKEMEDFTIKFVTSNPGCRY